MNERTIANQKIHEGTLILVNRAHPYVERKEDRMELVPAGDRGTEVLLRRRAARLLEELMASIRGWRGIAAVSGWRSMEEQRGIWDDSMLENGEDFTNKYVAAPGCSEHQTGLAIDLGKRQEKIDFIRPEFPYHGLCQTFRRAAPRFGFIERYPRGKEAVTGIGHEPWHFRYVGVPHAAIMEQEGLVLEEYMDFIREYPYGRKARTYEQGGVKVSVSYLPASGGEETRLQTQEDIPCSVSGNNVDGFIITEWRGCYGKAFYEDTRRLRRA